MLHYLPVHMCGWDQLWTVPLPPLHVWNTRGHQSRLRLVHVLCLGWTGPDVAGWLPVYTGSFSLPATHPRGAQAQAGERLCVTRRRTFNRHLSPPETAASPDAQTITPGDSEQREPSRKQSTGAGLSLTWKRKGGDLWLTAISVPLVLFSYPSLWMNCSVLIACSSRGQRLFQFSSCKICLKKEKKKVWQAMNGTTLKYVSKIKLWMCLKVQLCIIMYPYKTRYVHVLLEMYVCRCICVYSRKNMKVKTKLCLREMFCCSWGLSPIQIFLKNKAGVHNYFFFLFDTQLSNCLLCVAVK